MDAQELALRSYVALMELRSEWSGKVLLSFGLDAVGRSLTMAASVAGAVSLLIEPDAAELKTATRVGACDFVVNTLDEALRVMKNELRQRRPLAVGLEGNAAELVPAMVARGVRPDVVAVRDGMTVAVNGLGALPVRWDGSGDGRVLHWDVAATLRERRMRDEAMLAEAEDDVERRWLELAPRFFARDLHRCSLR